MGFLQGINIIMINHNYINSLITLYICHAIPMMLLVKIFMNHVLNYLIELMNTDHQTKDMDLV